MRNKQTIRQLCEASAEKTAKIIGMCAWYDEADKILTVREQHEVRKLWNTMPGHTCWNDAFLRWMKTSS